MLEVHFHPEARDDYREALTWYRDRSPRAAERFEGELERVVGLVSTRPTVFPAYDEEHRFATLNRFPYSLVYEVHADRIFVIAVAHSRRSAGYWQGRS